MQRLQVTLPGGASSVPPARHFVEQALTDWGLERLAWTAALLVTELAANAALHAGTDFTVAVGKDDGLLRIEVSDASAHLPRQRNHSAESTTGRGLRLVAELATQWGVQPDGAGKVVWVELACAEPGLDEEDDGDVDVDALLDSFSDDGLDAAADDAADDADVKGRGQRLSLALAA